MLDVCLQPPFRQEVTKRSDGGFDIMTLLGWLRNLSCSLKASNTETIHTEKSRGNNWLLVHFLWAVWKK